MFDLDERIQKFCNDLNIYNCKLITDKKQIINIRDVSVKIMCKNNHIHKGIISNLSKWLDQGANCNNCKSNESKEQINIVCKKLLDNKNYKLILNDLKTRILHYECNLGHINSIGSRYTYFKQIDENKNILTCICCQNKERFDLFKNQLNKTNCKPIDNNEISYVTMKSVYNVCCVDGAVRRMSLYNVNKHEGCTHCILEHKNSNFDIYDLKKIVNLCSLKLISNIYKNETSNITVQCFNGHVFDTTLKSIRDSVKNISSICKLCTSKIYISEEIVREYLKYLTGYDFIKTNPEWLLNKQNRKLELDGYCSDLSMAFEHQGPHHYDKKFSYNVKNKKDTKKAYDKYLKTKLHDSLKINTCKKYNVKLIIVPELFTKCKNLHNFLINKLKKYNIHKDKSGISIAEKDDIFNSVKLKIYNKDYSEFYLDIANKISIKNNWELISDQYVSSMLPLQWKCKRGHIINLTLDAAKHRNNCTECYKKSLSKIPTHLSIDDVLYMVKNNSIMYVSKKLNVSNTVILNLIKINKGIK